MKLLLLFIGVAICMEAENSRLKETNTALREALQSLEEGLGFEMDIGQSEEYLAEQDAGHDFRERAVSKSKRSRWGGPSYSRRRRRTTTKAPRKDCYGSWSSWSKCSKTCGGGSRTRTYYVKTYQSGGGRACRYRDGEKKTERCNTKKCTTTTTPTSTPTAAAGDYVLLRSNVECADNANEYKMGTFDSVDACAEACKSRDGCTNFIFGKMNKLGGCWDEGITESACTTWETDEYDFYGFGTKACVNVNHIYDNPGAYTCECVPYDDPCITKGLCVAEDACPVSDGQLIPNYICKAGYVDKTGGNANNWACGSQCEGGRYYTDLYCGCACVPNPYANKWDTSKCGDHARDCCQYDDANNYGGRACLDGYIVRSVALVNGNCEPSSYNGCPQTACFGCFPAVGTSGFEMDVGQSEFTCSSSQLAGVGPTNEECWDEEYPCDSCCSTGLGIDQDTCWDGEKYTRESCCGSGFENSQEEAIGQKGSVCPEFRCMRFCEYGNIKDENGCDTCLCNELDPRKKFRDTGVPGESYRKCPKRNCPQQVCDFGFFKDKNGCDTCKCNDDRMSERPRPYKN